MLIRKTFLLVAASFANLFLLAQTPRVTVPLAFEVATIKPSKAVGWRLQPTPDGYTATGVSLKKLLREAYGVYDDKLLTGGPAWIDSDTFDIEAKFDTTEIPEWDKLTFRQRADMLQPLLAERFKLRVHHEQKAFPVFNLVIARGGPKLQPSKPQVGKNNVIGITCYVLQNRSGYTQRKECTIASLLDLLRNTTDRSVVDKTGLSGRYDFELRWMLDSVAPTAADDYSGPSIFTAVQDQLGLKLVPSAAPLDVLVIDHAERPSEN